MGHGLFIKAALQSMLFWAPNKNMEYILEINIEPYIWYFVDICIINFSFNPSSKVPKPTPLALYMYNLITSMYSYCLWLQPMEY